MRMSISLVVVALLAGGASADLIITEIVDGPLVGLPKFFELTNTGPGDIPDLSVFSVAREANALTTLSDITALPASPLAEGASFVVAAEATTFTAAFGFSPDLVAGAANNNGDDRVVVADSASTDIILDIYGVEDTDGTGQFWEYHDTRVYRAIGAAVAQPSFISTEWVINPINDFDVGSGLDTAPVTPEVALICNPGFHGNHALSLATQFGTGDLDSPSPALMTPISSADLISGVLLASGGLGLHGANPSSEASFTDGDANTAGGTVGLLNDANGNNQRTTLSATFASPEFITGLNIYTHNSGADARIFANCHIYLDFTDDAADNPTFFAEAVLGGPGADAGSDTWGALYLALTSGVFGGTGVNGDGAVHGMRLDFYSVTDTADFYRAEGKGAGGSLIREIDVLGVAVPAELSVFATE